MFDVPPDPIAFTLGPLSIGWYGLGEGGNEIEPEDEGLELPADDRRRVE